MLDIICIPVTPLQQNCRIIVDQVRRSAVIVDPGGDANAILNVITKNNLTPVEIWLTHSHFDHCGGVADVLAKYKVPLRGHQEEALMRSKVEEIAVLYGLENSGFRNSPEPDFMLNDNEILKIGDHEFQCLFTPGHSPGHICFYHAKQSILIAGDTLFSGSIGRTDLPLGSFEQLSHSIKTKIYTLPDETIVMPGHGPNTKVGLEKRNNPFVRA